MNEHVTPTLIMCLHPEDASGKVTLQLTPSSALTQYISTLPFSLSLLPAPLVHKKSRRLLFRAPKQ